MKRNVSIDDEIKKAQLQKLKAEIEKVEEEKRKVRFENDTTEEKQKTPYYKSKEFIRVLLGLVLGIPFVFTYLKLFIIPALELENIRIARDVEDQKNELTSLIHEKEALLDSLDDLKIYYNFSTKSSSLRYLKEFALNELSNYRNQSTTDAQLLAIEKAFRSKRPVIMGIDSVSYKVSDDPFYDRLDSLFRNHDPESPLVNFERRVFQGNIEALFFEMRRPLDSIHKEMEANSIF